MTSGGDAPGMNSAVRALARLAGARDLACLGVVKGYEGLIDGRFRDLVKRDEKGVTVDQELEYLAGTGGTFLGSARSERFRTTAGRAQAAERIKERGIDALIVIGGDGSLAGADIFNREHGVPFMGIPASIDNDIGCTALSIGVDTALNTIVEACDRINDTARAHHRAFIVEVMGRDCGFLALASAVAVGADAALFREQGKSEEEIVSSVQQVVNDGFRRGKQRLLIIKSEGVGIPCTRLARKVNAHTEDDDVRATVLGHLVRGGAPSYQDRRIAGRLALQAFEALVEGKSGMMVAWQPTVAGGEPTKDPAIACFDMDTVMKETKAIRDGTSEIVKWRNSMMEHVEGVLAL